MVLGKKAGGFKSSIAFSKFLEQLKRQKASSDDIKRVGITATIRYTERRGLQIMVGPWMFYYPNLAVMSYLLPVIFSIPALLVTLLGLFIQLDKDVTDAIEQNITGSSNRKTSVLSSDNLSSGRSEPLATASSTDHLYPALKTRRLSSAIDDATLATKATHISPAITTQIQSSSRKTKPIKSLIKRPIKSLIKSLKKKTTSRLLYDDSSNSSISQENGRKRQPRSVMYWHKEILKWVNTKTAALGYDFGSRHGYNFLQRHGHHNFHHNALSSRFVFEIQSFYFTKTLQKLSSLSLLRWNNVKSTKNAALNLKTDININQLRSSNLFGKGSVEKKKRFVSTMKYPNDELEGQVETPVLAAQENVPKKRTYFDKILFLKKKFIP
jgi:hypothetical protein